MTYSFHYKYMFLFIGLGSSIIFLSIYLCFSVSFDRVRLPLRQARKMEEVDQCQFSNTRFHKGQKVAPVVFKRPVGKEGTENVSGSASHQENGDHHRRLQRKSTPKDCSKSSVAPSPSTGSTTTYVDPGKKYQKNVVTARDKVMEILREFRAYCKHILKMDKENNYKRKRVDFLAAKMIKKKFRFYPDKPFSGSVPGVEIGDEFHYRMELNILGLHLPSQGGIGYMQLHRGKIVATSVVDSGGYDNYMASQDTLVYCGQGGNNTSANTGLEVAEDQELKGGNLALFNSIRAKNPVRVIRRSKVSRASTTYFYDGLYTVEKMWEEKGLNGKRVYRFKLVKMPGQASLLARRN